MNLATECLSFGMKMIDSIALFDREWRKTGEFLGDGLCNISG
jgi:hypothetical protein